MTILRQKNLENCTLNDRMFNTCFDPNLEDCLLENKFEILCSDSDIVWKNVTGFIVKTLLVWEAPLTVTYCCVTNVSFPAFSKL